MRGQSDFFVNCLDKDECSVNNGGCSHSCVNTDGGYTCACPEGYTLAENRTHCIGELNLPLPSGHMIPKSIRKSKSVLKTYLRRH